MNHNEGKTRWGLAAGLWKAHEDANPQEIFLTGNEK
jgi:hypothetical protein